MQLTNDQYQGLSKLERWYQKYDHQFIEISGVVGTGAWDLVQQFIDNQGFDGREVMYLSYDQKQVLELAAKRYHAYYINGIIYNYTRIVDFDSLPVVNPHSDGIVRYEWKKDIRKKVDPKYKLIVVFDSVLMSHQTLMDLATFELPVILLRDPMLTPAPDTYTFMKDPNITLREVHPLYAGNPIMYFAHKILLGEKIQPGSYDNVSVVPRKSMNLYNLRSSDMNITVSEALRQQTNKVYRENILKRKDSVNIVGERLIVMSNMYDHKIVNPDEKKIKVYLTRGTVGYITKINRHVPGTKYVPIEFRAEFYHEPFGDLVLERHKLNGIEAPSRQIVPDEIIEMEYAYALSVPMARVGHWDKVTLIVDQNELNDPDLQRKLLYTAISKARKSLTIVI